MKINIATKTILTTLVLVLFATIPLSQFSSHYYADVSRQKESATNLQTASAKAVEIENLLKALFEKSKSISQLYLRSVEEKSNSIGFEQSVDALFEDDQEIMALEIYQVEDGSPVQLKTLEKKIQDSEKQKDMESLAKLRASEALPLESLIKGDVIIQGKVLNGRIPLFYMALPVKRNEWGQVSGFAVAYIYSARVQRSFVDNQGRVLSLLDRKGRVLAHTYESEVLQNKNLENHPLFNEASLSTLPQGVLHYSVENESFAGAYSKTTLGPVVISQVPNLLIEFPAREARRQSLLITGIVLSFTVILSFLFSTLLTRPIEKLAFFIQEVSKGNYDFSAQAEIKTKDELGLLARVFDSMVDGLKERAKAYAVMRQAMGASVVDTLMKMKEEELGGQKKKVAILFSDLRNFTQFSEGHTPEEVVLMLNEYFDVMVKTIYKRNGWLDKFIGDAIMAVWGVPYTGNDDSQQALHSALEMRMELQKLNDRRIERGLSPLSIGIGLHVGDAIVGKIGATERANLTVIGDSVNLASRIEASTKSFGVDILVSQEFMEECQKDFIFELAGAVEVKGKSQPQKLFEVRGRINPDGSHEILKTDYSSFEKGRDDKVKIAA